MSPLTLTRYVEQRDAESEKWENERRRDTTAWERARDDGKANWLRAQRRKSYLEVLDHLSLASELASDLPPAQEEAERPYRKEDEMPIAKELRTSYRWVTSARAVCGADVTAKLKS